MDETYHNIDRRPVGEKWDDTDRFRCRDCRKTANMRYKLNLKECS